jgi:hypothetical protein
MKYLNLLLLFFSCLLSPALFAQTPRQIEDDLLKSFRKVAHLRPRGLYDSDTTRGDPDSLGEANYLFSIKLKNYTNKFPFTINQPFHSLQDSIEDTGLEITGSADGQLRIYAWDTGLGGTQPDIANVIQYKAGQRTRSIIVEESTEVKIPYCDSIRMLKKNQKTYYIAIYSAKMSLHDHITGVRIFSIENDTLNDNVKLIKTSTGLHSRIEFGYVDTYIYQDLSDWPIILYDEKTTKLKIPVVLENGEANGNYITYKFSGQYFERVKN